MEIPSQPTPEQRRQNAAELIKAAERGEDVSNADPRESSMEAVIIANRIRRAARKIIKIIEDIAPQEAPQ